MVSGNRPEVKDRQAPLAQPSTEVGLARISQDERGAVACSCGWLKIHARQKVREDAAERHLNRKHGGMGIWL